MGNCTVGNCLPTSPGQTDARLGLGSGVGLPGITGCSFNLSFTRCITNNGQQKWHPATSSGQSDSDTPANYPSRGFALKSPDLKTTKSVLTSLVGSPISLGWSPFLLQVLTFLGWLSNFPWLDPLSPLSPQVPTSLGWLHFSSYSN